MEWIEIDKDNLPEDEVLAANFQEGTFGYREKLIGCLYLALRGSSFAFVQCENDHEVLDYCTHYILIHKFDK